MTSEAERFGRASEFEARYYDEKRTQADMILEYLKRYGSITPLEALTAIGCFRLSARIADLRGEGHEIDTTLNKGKKQFAIYTLRESEDGNNV